MDNPLFGVPLISPTPAHEGVFVNPIWSATRGTPPQDGPTSIVRGMRRMVPGQHIAPSPAPTAMHSVSAAAAMGRDRPEEASFAEALTRLVRGEAGPAETILAFADICRSRAQDLRDLANAQLQRAPRYMALTESAAELEAEAATWQLLWFLHGVPGREFPAGSGGDFVEGAGFAKTWRQLAADVVFQDDVLNRAARAVAWLEALAAAADPEPEQGLARKDGVWQETKAKLTAGIALRTTPAAGSVVTEVDPDATTRQRARLDEDNTKDEERLMRMVWRLVRAGHAGRAVSACEYAGQPWRSASLAGAGPHGPLPLGVAAEVADAEDIGDQQAEILAGEVEWGPGAARGLWRWSCYQAAERVAAGTQSSGSGTYEAAVYGILSSHLSRALPVCASWEDSLWAHLRCWLDCAIDTSVASSATAQRHDSVVSWIGVESLWENRDSASDAAAAAEGFSTLTVGGWPMQRVRDALPRTFEEAVEAGGALFGGASAASTSGAQRFRRVQLDLILDRVEGEIGDALIRWIVGDSHEPSAGPACPPGLMRFAAHLALVLWTLGVASVPEDAALSAAYAPLHDRLQRLVQVYAVHLIDSGAHALVPAYSCHLRAGLRRATCLLLLEQMAMEREPEECKELYRGAAAWFKAWGSGDVAPDEMAIVARKAVAKAQMDSEGGPVARARSLAWLFIDDSTPGVRGEAVSWACVLCREFALSGAGGIAAALSLLGTVIPAALSPSSPGGEASRDSERQAASMNELLRQAQRDGAGQWAAELQGWINYFDLQSEYVCWEEVYSTAVAEVQARGEDPERGALAELARDTEPLLLAAVKFLKDGPTPCPWLVSNGSLGGNPPMAGGPPGEIAVVLAPDDSTLETDNLASPVVAGTAYPSFSSAAETTRASHSVVEALQLAATNADGTVGPTFQAGAAPNEGSVRLPGLMSVAVDVGEEEPAVHARKVQTATTALSLALKGALCVTDGTPVGPFIVTNVSAEPAVVAALCTSVVWPRVAVLTAALRQALAGMGHPEVEGTEVLQLVHGQAELFSDGELRTIRELESNTAALYRRHQRQLQEAAELE